MIYIVAKIKLYSNRYRANKANSTVKYLHILEKNNC